MSDPFNTSLSVLEQRKNNIVQLSRLEESKLMSIGQSSTAKSPLYETIMKHFLQRDVPETERDQKVGHF